jgi:hypothetical protein
MFPDQREDKKTGKILWTLHAEACKKDRRDTKAKGTAASETGETGRRLQETGKKEADDEYKNRRKIFGYSRIDLQFDWRNELMAYWR